MSVDKLYLFVISVIFTFGFTALSVNAIRCHQCNSHSDPACISLQIPKSMKISDKYLKECTGNYDGMEPFCRKTSYTIEFSDEHRVVRSCGWLRDTSIHADNQVADLCLNADNEGFKEVICNCHKDGCNSAPIQLKSISLLGVLSFVLIIILV